MKCISRILLTTVICLQVCFPISAQQAHEDAHNMAAISALVNNGGPGIGLLYERFFGTSNKVSLALPVSFCFGYAKAHSSHYTSEGEDKRPLMVFVNPGIRFYPTGANGVVRYALGANVIIGGGKGMSNAYVNGTNQLTTRGIVGAAITNSVNFAIAGRIRTGLELSLGICHDDGINAGGTVPFGQLAVHIGYKW